jgi:cobaltochelatase CobT
VVILLIDNSDSVRGRPITVAAMCGNILSRTQKRCAVKVEVLGFTSRSWQAGRSGSAGWPTGSGAIPAG